MTDINIRKAKKSDIPDLVRLGNELNEFHKDDTKLDPIKLDQDWKHIEAFVAETKNKKIVGFLSGYNSYQFHMTTFRYEIQNLHVDKRHRRMGIAKDLVSYVIAIKKANGVSKFSLGVEADNNIARLFYKKIGFTEQSQNQNIRCKIEG